MPINTCSPRGEIEHPRQHDSSRIGMFPSTLPSPLPRAEAGLEMMVTTEGDRAAVPHHDNHCVAHTKGMRQGHSEPVIPIRRSYDQSVQAHSRMNSDGSMWCMIDVPYITLTRRAAEESTNDWFGALAARRPVRWLGSRKACRNASTAWWVYRWRETHK